jgi:hypothetical protein
VQRQQTGQESASFTEQEDRSADGQQVNQRRPNQCALGPNDKAAQHDLDKEPAKAAPYGRGRRRGCLIDQRRRSQQRGVRRDVVESQPLGRWGYQTQNPDGQRHHQTSALHESSIVRGSRLLLVVEANRYHAACK